MAYNNHRDNSLSSRSSSSTRDSTTNSPSSSDGEVFTFSPKHMAAHNEYQTQLSAHRASSSAESSGYNSTSSESPLPSPTSPKDGRCVVGTCPQPSEHSEREHCHLEHLPAWMMERGQQREEMVRRRVNAASWLLQVVHDIYPVRNLNMAELQDLWERTKPLLKLPLVERVTIPERITSRAVCCLLGVEEPKVFSLARLNSLALITHWAVMSFLLSTLDSRLRRVFRFLPFRASPGSDLVDAHCHLDRLACSCHVKGHQVDALLAAAPQPPPGVAGILSEVVANFCDTREHKDIPAWLKQEGEVKVYATVGLHPKEAAKLTSDRLNKHLEGMLTYLAMDRVVGMGEVGLDYSQADLRTEFSRSRQTQHLQRIMAMVPPGTPLVIHTRGEGKDRQGRRFSAQGDVLELLRQCPVDFPVQLHCFTGDASTVRDFLALDRTVYFSVSHHTLKGRDFVRALPEIPDDRLLVETDSPYLSPMGGRGGLPNSPRLVGMVLQQLAKLKDWKVQHLAWLTAANARQFFKLN